MSDTRRSAAPGDAGWGADWETHRQRQLTFALAATPAERLAWLEEMIALAHHTGALPRRRPEDAAHADRDGAPGTRKTTS